MTTTYALAWRGTQRPVRVEEIVAAACNADQRRHHDEMLIAELRPAAERGARHAG